MDTAHIATRFVAPPPPPCRERSNRASHPQVLRVTCGEKKEKKEKTKKLVKGLKKDLAMFAKMRFGIDQNSGLVGSVQESMITEAAEVLMKQLRCVQEAKKETKKRKKQENKKHKIKSIGMHTEVINNPSTSLEDSLCFNSAADTVAQVLRQSSNDHDKQHKQPSQKLCKKVEICMGGKCRNSGAKQLLEQIQSVEAKEENMNVVECKCLGKCKTSPNIRLSYDNAVPVLCSNVRISDVDSLISDFVDL